MGAIVSRLSAGIYEISIVRSATREVAFGLYERGWRLVDTASLSREERRLIGELKEEFGGGVINA